MEELISEQIIPKEPQGIRRSTTTNNLIEAADSDSTTSYSEPFEYMGIKIYKSSKIKDCFTDENLPVSSYLSEPENVPDMKPVPTADAKLIDDHPYYLMKGFDDVMEEYYLENGFDSEIEDLNNSPVWLTPKDYTFFIKSNIQVFNSDKYGVAMNVNDHKERKHHPKLNGDLEMTTLSGKITEKHLFHGDDGTYTTAYIHEPDYPITTTDKSEGGCNPSLIATHPGRNAFSIKGFAKKGTLEVVYIPLMRCTVNFLNDSTLIRYKKKESIKLPLDSSVKKVLLRVLVPSDDSGPKEFRIFKNETYFDYSREHWEKVLRGLHLHQYIGIEAVPMSIAQGTSNTNFWYDTIHGRPTNIDALDF